jgi:hypothetical protein
MKARVLLLLAMFAGLAQAQFQLFSVSSAGEVQVPPVFQFGDVSSGASAQVQFRVRNVSAAPASLYSLSLAGSGFMLPAGLGLPQTLNPQAALDFTIQFQANEAGSYSAGLTLPGISVILTATVVPALLYSVNSPVDFGSVERGSSAAIQVVVQNHSTTALALPPLVVNGQGFSLSGAPGPGSVVGPQQSTDFGLHFSPTADGAYIGVLSAGDRTFALVGQGVEPALPKPILSVVLAQAASGQQGTLQIAFDAAARVAGTGTLTLDFQGPSDPAVAFAAGGRNISFPISLGDTQAPPVPFQTGTTAGTLVFAVTMGSAIAQQTVAIAPQAVAISSAQATRSGSGFTVQITGFDNTRTASPLAFTFYDRAGNVVPPSPIQATADFGSFFQNSSLGGLFLLEAVFPVNGDPSQIAAFTVQMTNSAGASSTGRTSF